MESPEIKEQETYEVDTKHKADDFFGKHNIFSRIMILTVTFLLIYAVTAPLDGGIITTLCWLFYAIFASITFGINSLKIIANFILQLKGKK